MSIAPAVKWPSGTGTAEPETVERVRSSGLPHPQDLPAVDTVLRMKVIAAAMEAEAGETDPYPGSPGVFQAVTALRAAYDGSVPRMDQKPQPVVGLGNVRPQLGGFPSRSGPLVSYGSDGQPENPYPTWTLPQWSTLYAPETTQTLRRNSSEDCRRGEGNGPA